MANCAVIVDSLLKGKRLEEVIGKHLPFLPEWKCCVLSPSSIRSGTDYNNYLTTVAFWEQFQQYDRILIFQHDSELLRLGVEEFLDYDYVGAPWQANAPWARADRKGGNGGLSLRNPKKALNLILEFPYRAGYGNEDVYFTHWLEKVGGLVAPYEICSKFSCETEFKLGTLGYHAVQKHLTPLQVEQVVNQYQ